MRVAPSESDLKEILNKLDQNLDKLDANFEQKLDKFEAKFDTLSKDVGKIKLSQVRLEEKVEGLSKRRHPQLSA